MTPAVVFLTVCWLDAECHTLPTKFTAYDDVQFTVEECGVWQGAAFARLWDEDHPQAEVISFECVRDIGDATRPVFELLPSPGFDPEALPEPAINLGALCPAEADCA